MMVREVHRCFCFSHGLQFLVSRSSIMLYNPIEMYVRRTCTAIPMVSLPIIRSIIHALWSPILVPPRSNSVRIMWWVHGSIHGIVGNTSLRIRLWSCFGPGSLPGFLNSALDRTSLSHLFSGSLGIPPGQCSIASLTHGWAVASKHDCAFVHEHEYASSYFQVFHQDFAAYEVLCISFPSELVSFESHHVGFSIGECELQTSIGMSVSGFEPFFRRQGHVHSFVHLQDVFPTEHVVGIEACRQGSASTNTQVCVQVRAYDVFQIPRMVLRHLVQPPWIHVDVQFGQVRCQRRAKLV
mmetsp:Transcript_4145/g.26199  ORF Transcript_4145/g.26199 Transcript_4145/m.26199 type:complete len:296 (-) Transcript_4145:62-949(-)